MIGSDKKAMVNAMINGKSTMFKSISNQRAKSNEIKERNLLIIYDSFLNGYNKNTPIRNNKTGLLIKSVKYRKVDPAKALRINIILIEIFPLCDMSVYFIAYNQ
jgi:hypothetical protein